MSRLGPAGRLHQLTPPWREPLPKEGASYSVIFTFWGQSHQDSNSGEATNHLDLELDLDLNLNLI